jgi:hypothetical protein
MGAISGEACHEQHDVRGRRVVVGQVRVAPIASRDDRGAVTNSPKQPSSAPRLSFRLNVNEIGLPQIGTLVRGDQRSSKRTNEALK